MDANYGLLMVAVVFTRPVKPDTPGRAVFIRCGRPRWDAGLSSIALGHVIAQLRHIRKSLARGTGRLSRGPDAVVKVVQPAVN